MVLISHSMGGLLSQMQAVTTGRVLWNDVFERGALAEPFCACFVTLLITPRL
jgi:hypothetical protein